MQERHTLAMPDDNPTLDVTPAAPPREPRGGGWRLRVARSLRGRSLVRLQSSIGMRLGLLALALGLPFVVYVGGNAVRQASIAHEYAQQRTLALARVVAARVDDVVGDNLVALALVRHGVTLDASATRANDAFLAKIRADLPRTVHNMGVWTLDGRNVGMLNRTSADAGLSIADRDYFQRTVRTSDSAIEGPLPANDDATPVAVFTRPVIGATGAVVGVVTLSTDLTQVQRLLDLGGAVPSGTVISIVNAGGVVLARSVDADRWVGMSVLAVGKARQHLASREGVDETLGADNVPRIAGYTQAKRAPWHVFVGMPADAALDFARSNRFETLALGALSLLLGIGIAARLGVRIARPLHRLAYDATLMARGNLAHRTSIGGDDETGVLASTLNRLAQTVEERTRALPEKTGALEEKTAALEHSRGELATITANVPVLIAYIDAGERFRFVNEYYRDVFGTRPERVIGHRLRALLDPNVYARIESR
jgi:HAMP domain-containing protein